MAESSLFLWAWYTVDSQVYILNLTSNNPKQNQIDSVIYNSSLVFIVSVEHLVCPKKKKKKKNKLESVHRAQTPSQYIFQVQKLFKMKY